LAVKGKPAEMVCDELRLRAGRTPEKDNLSAQIVGAVAENGWYLIVARGRDHRLIGESVIAPLSNGCDVLTCTIDERNIFSAATAWRNGARVWSVSYDGESEGADVVVEGNLPSSLNPIRERYTALAQADDAGDALVDPMYEIPIEMAYWIAGYRPYDEGSAFAGRFVELSGLDTPLWKRLTIGG
jgi:hypothetical protein